MCVLYVDEVVERLLSMKRLNWGGSVVSFAPKPHSRRSPVTHPASSSQTDESQEEEVEQFYDAESSLISAAH